MIAYYTDIMTMDVLILLITIIFGGVNLLVSFIHIFLTL